MGKGGENMSFLVMSELVQWAVIFLLLCSVNDLEKSFDYLNNTFQGLLDCLKR